ncbi:2-C-methyl-D-erythritol 4-phosphate cytidylyltransferase [Algoriphagus zhangzhouensis]|uniref:2-C-methyl-D-erythritol 4-phosphate cytidylyltransferase n=1 Tax=Algoriphagus zhangzhouensis TaxID=1073327 RepID=A0A1M7ZJE9_9BACT|nr:2-C-methyl-D-erythritol 4-phosphate cytidylyltransferase [Algoriphagus zhangzhouensis]TDY43709.1 2-C-methyl-D-erythritol 4-phosphate cytidylyltransferase [Algoriphagus zhangzhouensis]SHO64786.1 2-C-methyl-D-erythritol 4-phosphate cytidylyltransferase [Algoriphagus zhangzhouensis]
MRKAAVLVAGGKGTRMGGPISKQYLPIGGKPILMHTLEVFYKVDPETELILVIPELDFDYWNELVETFGFKILHQVVAGGNSRFQSVKNGLNAITFQEGLVAIHDGVRPFVKPSVIESSFEEAERSGSGIAVISLKDSIRKLTDDGKSFYQERQYFRLVQTPQTFQLEKIRKAFRVTEIPQFTDDATVYEHQGWQVSLIPGNPENIKITTPEDMDYAEFLLSLKK